MSDSNSPPKLDSLLANHVTPSVAETTPVTPAVSDATPIPATAPITTTTAVTEPTTAIVSPLREDLIKSAVSFLSSTNVRSADKGKKIAFLQKKGLNQAEIDEAFKRSGGDDVSSTAVSTSTPVSNSTATNSYTPPLAPVLPARNANYGPPQIVYYPQPASPPIPAEKVFAMAVILGMGAVGLTAGAVGLLKQFIAPLLNRIAEYQRTRYNQRKEIADKLQKSLKSFCLENDDLDAVIDQGDENTVMDALASRQTELSSKIDTLIISSRERITDTLKQKTYSDFRSDLTSFKNVVQGTSPYSSYASYAPGTSYNRNNSDSAAVAGLKSDIRSLKAVLLNRRNFPQVA
ncbi:hypothetical protein INT47_003121 [Mucor saturninus]|uniref:Peroxisomal membrane protein PEX14 n=1 Tax=Mucor saturninus TaxID=64648 RepID=A0A8H7QLS0_9FUNG|nr:hypothetical protein INT47_003121 [Mucor saturninus]